MRNFFNDTPSWAKWTVGMLAVLILVGLAYRSYIEAYAAGILMKFGVFEITETASIIPEEREMPDLQNRFAVHEEFNGLRFAVPFSQYTVADRSEGSLRIFNADKTKALVIFPALLLSDDIGEQTFYTKTNLSLYEKAKEIIYTTPENINLFSPPVNVLRHALRTTVKPVLVPNVTNIYVYETDTFLIVQYGDLPQVEDIVLNAYAKEKDEGWRIILTDTSQAEINTFISSVQIE